MANNPPELQPAFSSVATAQKALDAAQDLIKRLDKISKNNEVADALVTPSLQVLKEVCIVLGENQIAMAEKIARLEAQLEKFENPRLSGKLPRP